MLLTNLRQGSFPNQTRPPVCRSKTCKSPSQLSAAANVVGLAAAGDDEEEGGGGVTLAHKYSALGVVAVAHSILVGHRAAAAAANAEPEEREAR